MASGRRTESMTNVPPIGYLPHFQDVNFIRRPGSCHSWQRRVTKYCLSAVY